MDSNSYNYQHNIVAYLTCKADSQAVSFYESRVEWSDESYTHRAKQLAPCNCIVTSLKRDQKEQKGGHI